MSDLTTVRSLIQDVPLFYAEDITADGTNKLFQLKYFPLVDSSVTITGGTASPVIDNEMGLVTFVTAPNAGTVNFTYKHVLLTDDAIESFLDLEDDDIRLAAADALDAIASSQVLILKKITSLDLTTDGPAVAKSLRDHAKILRDRADIEASSAFDFAEVVYDEAGARELIVKDFIKQS